MHRVLHILTGCTAVGKTELSLHWAEARGAEILSCDSLLFYRGMDIGTAKPATTDRLRVPHHLIDILEVSERMDVARYVKLAQATAAEVSARGRPVLVTGGSGFYLKAFLGPVVDAVAVPLAVREGVERLELEAAVAELRKRNPAGLGALDVANPRRVRRALERCRASGLTLAELEAAFVAQPGPFADWEIRLTRLDRPQAELEARIRARVHAMLDAGLVEEVRRLRAAGLESNASASRAVGYREVLAFLEGRLPEEELAPEIARKTRALVKKQRTWFRTQLPPHRAIAAATATVGSLFAEPV